MKKISIVIGCYNEEKNIQPLIETIGKLFTLKLSMYDYEIVCIDNDSKDNTRSILRTLCNENHHVKAILNAQNFGASKSSVYGLLQATGDCVIKMCADFQDPPELIADFIQGWEEGYRIVLGIKKSTQEKKFKAFLRRMYYRIISKITEINHIDNFIGYGLYDRSFIEILRKLDDPTPYLRGIVAELGYKYKSIYYDQPLRKAGKSSYNFYRYYDYAMLGLTSYSKVPLRIATFLGMIVAFASFIVGIVYLVFKLIYWDHFAMGMAPVTIGVFFLGAVQLMFIGLLGEYILAINARSLKRPLVIEEERIGFNEDCIKIETKEAV